MMFATKERPQYIAVPFTNSKMKDMFTYLNKCKTMCAFGKRVLGKKLFKASSQRQGGRIHGEHPAVQDRSKISWF